MLDSIEEYFKKIYLLAYKELNQCIIDAEKESKKKNLNAIDTYILISDKYEKKIEELENKGVDTDVLKEFFNNKLEEYLLKMEDELQPQINEILNSADLKELRYNYDKLLPTLDRLTNGDCVTIDNILIHRNEKKKKIMEKYHVDIDEELQSLIKRILDSPELQSLLGDYDRLKPILIEMSKDEEDQNNNKKVKKKNI